RGILFSTDQTLTVLLCQGGVILGADTRATDDMVVADKNCMKIHHIAPSIYVCHDNIITNKYDSDLWLLPLRYQGQVGASLIVGGVDVTGAHLYSVYPHGSYDKLPFVTAGSGAAAAAAVGETLTLCPCAAAGGGQGLVRDAICAGIFCDLGSGSNVDLCVITEGGAKYLRGYDKREATRGAEVSL
uniref:Proteasome 20S subunit beta 10 n=1 Tax=Neogobius melanostomus TaxID=47308 RepID=A0A8C6SMS6_9GOBI